MPKVRKNSGVTLRPSRDSASAAVVNVASRGNAAEIESNERLRSFHPAYARYGSHTAGSVGRSGCAANAMTSRSAFGKFKGFKSQASTMLKTVTREPMAIANVVRTTAVKPGFRRRVRKPYLRSHGVRT